MQKTGNHILYKKIPKTCQYKGGQNDQGGRSGTRDKSDQVLRVGSKLLEYT